MKRNGDLITAPLGKAEAALTSTPVASGAAYSPGEQSGELPRSGALIVNADDWGRDVENTDRTLECIVRGTVSSVSAMVFMKDSERAAEIAREHGIDAGLHLNLTTEFSASSTPMVLIEDQGRISRYLGKRRFSQVVFHPGLASSFQYVVAAQRDEFCRLYGTEPKRLDGHHHMHLCANVLLQKVVAVGNDRSTELLVSARREKSVEPSVSTRSGQNARSAPRPHRLLFLAASART